jgi:hypothetical protein
MEEVKPLISQIPRLDTSNNFNSSLLQSKYHFTVGGITPKNYSIFHYGMEIDKIN